MGENEKTNGWYSIVSDNTLEQGDIIEEVKVAVPAIGFFKGETKEIDYMVNDVVILTQSCDLGNSKIPWVYVSPVQPLSKQRDEVSAFKNDKNLESIRRGQQYKYHMIAECNVEEFKREICIIDFRNVYSLPFAYVQELVNQGDKRIRLNSPYKEHLAQAYARFYMRVGLPNDIPRFA